MTTSILSHDENEVASPSTKDAAIYDRGLIKRFLGGDEEAFKEIHERYYYKIRLHCEAQLRSKEDAEEIAQDTFINAHRALKNFRGEASLYTWLYRVATNRCWNRYWYLKRRRIDKTLSLDYESDEGSGLPLGSLIPDGLPDAAQQLLTAEFKALIVKGMERLSEFDRSILLLHNGGQVSYEEMAARLGVNVGTVKSRLSRSRERLKKHVESEPL